MKSLDSASRKFVDGSCYYLPDEIFEWCNTTGPCKKSHKSLAADDGSRSKVTATAVPGSGKEDVN